MIICIQVQGNPGSSITNDVEDICHQVCESFDIPADKLVWLENYDCVGMDEWNLVTFGRSPPLTPFADPRWTQMTPELWKELRLRPKKELRQSSGMLVSKVRKLFKWPRD